MAQNMRIFGLKKKDQNLGWAEQGLQYVMFPNYLLLPLQYKRYRIGYVVSFLMIFISLDLMG